MKVCVLASGSRGNSTYVKSGKTALLIDCGLSVRSLENALNEIGEDITELSGVLITHEHSDHVCGLASLVEKYGTAVYVHRAGARALVKKSGINSDLLRMFDKPSEIGDLKADFIKLSHDSEYCVGYRIGDGRANFCCVTDAGYLPVGFESFFADCGLAVLESNHDRSMLMKGSYTSFLKERISGLKGHLSNEQAASMLVKLPELNVREVWLGHISENNNTEELVFSVALNALREADIVEGRDIKLGTVVQQRRSEYKDVCI